MRFGSPTNMQETYSLLANGDWKILAGGTDFYPSLNGEVPSVDVLDISRVDTMRGIEKDAGGNWHIGALATWTDILEHDLPPAFDGLKLSAREVGSMQIQNRATLVGNICNASPAADGVPPLLTLGAIVKIGSARGVREVALDAFITGIRKTVLQSDEIVIGLKIPAECTSGNAFFLKLGARKYLVISISMVAARLVVEDNVISEAAISVGSCSLVAARLHGLERELVGKGSDHDFSFCIGEEYFDVLAPISDVRATREFRLAVAREMVLRVIAATLKTF